MGEVIRELEEQEIHNFIPGRELLDSQSAEATIATAAEIARLIGEGVKDRVGHFLIQLEDGTQVSSPFGLYIGE